jgi:DedD protein
MFKFSKSASAGRDSDSVETIRRRAQYRLVGTALLVAIAIVGFPLLFDTEPRPLEVDLPIAIPSKDEVQPLLAPTAVAAAPNVNAMPAPAAVAPAEAIKPQVEPTQSDVTPQATASKQAEQASLEQRAQAAKDKQDEASRAQAILDGTLAKAAAKPASTTASATDYPNDGKRRVIQVGSFNDAERVREVRLRLERAGITTYTQVIQSNGLKFVRVRVGPFDDAVELQNFIDRVQLLKLEARVLTF